MSILATWLIRTLVSLVIKKQKVYAYMTERERQRNYIADKFYSVY